MKSSAPVFTRQNPFEPASKVGKAHYHPSCKQSLSKKEKKNDSESRTFKPTIQSTITQSELREPTAV
ncbi:hypothetical protein CesoFtcFv8_012904 [Champsocephalus esox]|uniref:Uncharacterized protein n=1 Tax=Champsocephalus esox TaxID=159716 RepID=A0AAN8BVB5_9TELE|nr:hypothetical protein CesoFtcFv8_012904 [Champsocephalus esox]